MFKTNLHLEYYKKKVARQFREEFGIHFSDSELRFAIAFLEDVIDETLFKERGGKASKKQEIKE